MKKLVFVLFAVLLLTGCDLSVPEETRETAPYYAGHTDHVAPVARTRAGFFVDTVRNEATTHYLSFREPDGCVTHVVSFDHWDEAPELHCIGKTFYYINGDVGGTEGILRSVTFAGEQKYLKAGELTLNYIVRTDDSYIYCAADEGQAYVRIPLDMSQWETVSREEAINAES